MKRRLGFGILAAAFALYPALALAGPASTATLSCGLGLPPGAPGHAEAEARLAREAEQNGYRRVCDGNLDRFRIAFRPPATTMADLPFQPVDLSATPFARFVSLGAALDRGNTARSRLYRGFRTPEGHTVTLLEHDLSVDGTSLARAPRDEPERINGLPARLSVFQTPAGKAISHLSWLERRRFYELWIDANVAGTPLRGQLFALAAALPPSVPGCPNEVPPKPPRLGADGFPVFEHSLPKVMTQAEMDALLDDSKRPCQ